MQLRMSPTLRFFEKSFKEKYNLEEYTSIYEPAIFCGIFRQNDRFAIKNHVGPMIIYLSGTDATHERVIKRIKKKLSDNNDVIVVAASVWIEDDLKKFNVPCRLIPLLRTDIDIWL